MGNPQIERPLELGIWTHNPQISLATSDLVPALRRQGEVATSDFAPMMMERMRHRYVHCVAKGALAPQFCGVCNRHHFSECIDPHTCGDYTAY